ncbi:MAG TPA: class I SAM-dependent methyltransferase [Pyrinomonadaceae bacterium]|nr:class I SAM-dependent methyltransferase [Pyrinomonadaceae bacterium]
MSEVLREWAENASAWQKHSTTIRTMFTPLTEAIIEEARITAGQRILDVAGGPGEPSLTIAETVGPTGSVMCTDAVAEMVAAAEAEARRRGLTNVGFRQCVAETLPFDDNAFDAVVSRLGAMFFPDVPAALREMLRVLKPARAACFVVWGKNELNPFTYCVSNVIARYVESPPAGPDEPGNAFRFAESGKLAGLLAQAGATDVRERELNFHLEAPITAEQFWEMRSATSGTLREKLATLPEDQRRRVASEVLEGVREFFPNGQMSFPAQMLIVSGRGR